MTESSVPPAKKAKTSDGNAVAGADEQVALVNGNGKVAFLTGITGQVR